ncbi:MAG: ComF family protein [Syntrophorhabdus sp.]|nr:ComF family protein [Syntrophorhabdus sp.]
MLSLFNCALALFYPESCVVCGADGSILCSRCIDDLRTVKETEVCPVCGRWLGRRIPCAACSAAEMGFSRGIYGFYYERGLRDAVHAFKFRGRKDVGRRLARLAGEKVRPLRGAFDRIVPVPVSGRRLSERGFNQSYIISEEISSITGGTLDHRTLVKRGGTRDQFTLSRRERRRNVRGAFHVRDGSSIEGERVLLVDDLFTTGYTASEAARTLKAAGSADVTLFALARTP